MNRFDWRLVGSVVCLSLPTAVVVAMGMFFMVDRVPQLIRNERRRVVAEYREQAIELKNRPETGFRIIRGKSGGWTKDRRISPGYWGYVGAGGIYQRTGSAPDELERVPDDQTLLWYLDEKGVCTAMLVKAAEEADFSFIFWVCGSFVLLLLVGATWMGVGYFVSYVKSRDDFLAATAHDLSTPLVGIRYSIGRDDNEAKVLVERLIRIVDNIKDFLKLGGKRRQPQFAVVDMARALDEAYALFREDYRDLFDGNDVEVSIDGNALAWADETMVVQILWNLLGNDLKYAAPYGAVRARIFDAGEFVVFELSDEGKGMGAKEMSRVFDRYYRAETVLSSGKGGFGIGLCTAREFAESMGGSLKVRVNGAKGCVFALALRRASAGAAVEGEEVRA